jgi:hypothetical protein
MVADSLTEGELIHAGGGNEDELGTFEGWDSTAVTR